MEKRELETLITDIRTYEIMSRNENYYNRLKEAHAYLKAEGVLNYEDFSNRKGLKVGAFTYTEMTIFDRFNDEEYKKIVSSGLRKITNHIQEYIDNPTIGDQLASWGTLGKTSYREEMIQNGTIVYGLTEEESTRRR